MKKKPLILATTLLVGIGVSLAFLRRPEKVAGNADFTVHFTCDTFGRLEPCGCFTGQHGGLTRLRTWLEDREDHKDSIKLDVGGAIAGEADYDIIQYRYLARAYATMGYSALNMGAREATHPGRHTRRAFPLLTCSHAQRFARPRRQP